MNRLLNGTNLTLEDACRIAARSAQVEIDPATLAHLAKTRELVFKLADSGVPIYGFTVGVGWNKDKQVFGKYFAEYNRNLIYAHCVGVGPFLTETQVRAVLLARLNTLLSGRTGIQLEVVEMYRDFLNRGIHPLIPARGSVGEGDIANLSHIGLAMLGEGDVHYRGRRQPATEALQAEGLTPITLGPKDGLAIVSSNALAAGTGLLVLDQAQRLLEVANAVYALSVEGLDGNITPLRPEPNEARRMASQIRCAAAMRHLLAGSYLESKGITKALQDPLGFRCAAALHGTVLDALDYVVPLLNIQLNTSDDNPCILLEQEEIISCCNFEITNWVLGFELLGQALAHLSRSACHRTIKLSDPEFTKLPRFLSPREGVVQAYQTIQKPFTALDAEIRHLMNPVSTDYFAVAGDIEDHATNAPLVVEKTAKILDNARYILGIEAMHAAQAVDLRGSIQLGAGSQVLYEAIRAQVPFLDQDRPLTPDIQAAYDVLGNPALIERLRGVTGTL
jgi:histidine ammonia-lyase